MKYRPEIDGLRAIAVLPVVCYHAGIAGVAGGFLGVDIFFVISGYLIGGIIFSELQKGSFSILHFYERRARRILPALFVVTLASSLAAWLWMSPESLSMFGKSMASVAFFVSNIHFWREAGYFALDAGLNPLLHTWSLAVEEQFYIFFPLLLIGLMSFGRRAVLPALLLLAGLSLGLADWTARVDVDTAFYLIHTRAWELFAGAMLAVSGYELAPRGTIPRELLAAAGLAMCLASFVFFDVTVRHPGLYTLVPVLGAVLIISLATEDTWVGRLLSLRPLVWTGLISYSLYLYHQPVLAFMRIREARTIEPMESFLAVLGCFMLAYLTWRFVEQPFRDRRVVSTNLLIRAAVAAVFVPAVLGITAVKMNGFPERTDNEIKNLLSQMRQGFKAREKGSRVGECHYNRKFGSFDKFLQRWDCLPKVDGPVILVFGDSHAADKSWALRSAGVNVGNLGGAGCPLTPDLKNTTCTTLMNMAIDMATSGKIQGLVLAQRWKREEVVSDKLDLLVKAWSRAGVPVLIFSPMPEFQNVEQQIVRNVRAGRGLDSIIFNEKLLAFTDPPVRAMAKQAGFTLIDTKEMFCATETECCSAFVDGKPLLVDYGHLSPYGAQAMGERIAANKVWQDWVAALEQH